MYRVIPHFLGELMTKYFRMEIEGAEHLPKTGPGIITPNHSGYAGLDALLLNHHVHKITGRLPRTLAHKLWYQSIYTAIPMKKFGFVKATKEQGLDILNKNQLMAIFPEGEHGNFKPSNKRYHLQEFKRGFVRMALQTESPIIPTLILGAEETHINLAKLKLPKKLKNIVLPLPLNIIPLPAKWKIIFMEPIYLPHTPEQADDRELVGEICSELREQMQERLSSEVSQRKHLYF